MDLAQLTADLDALRERATGRRLGARRTRPRSTRSSSSVLGKKGELTAILRGIGALPAEDRPKVGRDRERGPDRGRGAPSARRARGCGGAELAARLAAETVDVTTPGRPIRRGSLHPIVETAREIADVFAQFGFVVYEGPEIEDDVTNFQMLNIPPDHPARDLWDTLYLDVEGRLLRTHTSPGQIRVMHQERPPIRALLPGPLLPLRGRGREPRERVLPGRGPDDRRGHVDGRPQGPARPVRPRDVRRGPRDAVPPGLLPVHRAVASRSTSCASSATARSARPARAPAG